MNKYIFVKNMVLLLLFSKIYNRSCKMSLLYTNKKKCITSFLKAPSRHKKFFHQIVLEIFSVKFFFKFLFFKKINYKSNHLVLIKKKNFFQKVGSNNFTLVKFLISIKINLSKYYLTS